MQEPRKRSKTGIIIAVGAAVVVIALMVVWQRYEAKHADELKSFVLSTDVPETTAAEEPEGQQQQTTKAARVIPEDPEKILAMAEEALKDEGYFDANSRGKGFHVYFLLKKCLDCDGDATRVENLTKQLKELSDQGYGPWHVESADLAELDGKIKSAKEI